MSNEKIEGYSELDEREQAIIDAYVENVDEIEDVNQVLDNPYIFIDSKDRSWGEDGDDYDLGYTEVENCGIECLGRELLERYFDYAAFGRDLRLSDYTVTETEDGDLVAFWNY